MIPPSHDLRNFGASELQTASVRALKLRENWSRKQPRVHGLSTTVTRTYVGSSDELKLLQGARILVDVHRDRHSQRPATVIYAYSLPDFGDGRVISQLTISAILKDFDACIESRETELIIAGTCKRNDLE